MLSSRLVSWHLPVILAVFLEGCGTDDPGADETGSGGNVAQGSGGSESGGSESGGPGTGGSASGGSGSGGTITGGAASGGQGGQAGGTGGGTACEVQTSGPHLPGAARSAGFSGTDAVYAELYDQLCTVSSDCIAPCVMRGGTQDFCAEIACVSGSVDFCLPPTKWRMVDKVLSAGSTIPDATVTSLSLANGDEHDLLIVDDFGFELPDDAQVLGISATIRKGSESANDANDQDVRLVRGGIVGPTNLKSEQPWPVALTDVVHGSMSELWGENWSAAEINAQDFGLALGALPLTGSGRAYVDTIALTVYFQQPCD